MWKRVVNGIIQNVLLFFIGIVLVLGFYYHSDFYKLDLYSLIIAGGIAILIVLKITSWISKGNFLNTKYSGVLLFEPEDVNKILYSTKTQTIRIDRKSAPSVGKIYKAKLNLGSKNHFASLFITRFKRKKLKGINRNDLLREGGYTLRDFKAEWKRKHGTWNPNQKVRVIGFRVIDTK